MGILVSSYFWKVCSRKLVPIETMLYLVQNWFDLSDERIEDVDYEGLFNFYVEKKSSIIA